MGDRRFVLWPLARTNAVAMSLFSDAVVLIAEENHIFSLTTDYHLGLKRPRAAMSKLRL